MLVYIGTYTSGEGHGIYTCRLDTESGALAPTGQTAAADKPSFLAVAPNGKLLYAANETAKFEGEPGGSVSAFRIDPDTGGLSFVNRRASRGAAPCYVSIDAECRMVAVANYTGGSLCVLPVGQNGELGENSQLIQHEGHSVHPQRQKRPHTHSVTFAPDGRFAIAADLGMDKLLVYRVDAKRGRLDTAPAHVAPLHPGNGPRHIAFHPNGHTIYVVGELDCQLTVMDYDPESGSLRAVEGLPMLPEGTEVGGNSGADIHVAPSGRFVYASIRGHDSIVIFSADAKPGKLTLVGHQPAGGRTPRNFGITPDGRLLLAANQDSDNVVVFRINQETGQLAPTGHAASVPRPVCVCFPAVQ